VNKNLNHRERSEQKFEAQFQANEGTKLKKNKNKTNDGVSLLNLS
jgi:HSP20 family molecular chaperone IbpA